MRPSTPQYFNYTSKPRGMLKAICKRCEYGKDVEPQAAPAQATPTTTPTAARASIAPQRTGLVPFHGTQVRGAVVEGAGWVRVSDVCERLGVSQQGQLEALRNNPSFERYLSEVQEGRGRPSWYLRGDKVPGWVRTINANKVKAEARDALLWVQEQFDRVLHAWVTGAEMPASPAQQPTPANVADIGTSLAQGVNALMATLVQAITQQVVSEVRGLLGEAPQQVAETHATVRGATRIEIVQEVTVDGWASDGHWYIAVNERDGLMSLGETTKDPPALRLDDGDYNGNKAGDRCWVMVHSARTDRRKGAQAWIQQMARQFGCRHIGGDRFAYDLDFVAEARRLVGPIRVDAMKQRAADDGMFLPPLFRSAA